MEERWRLDEQSQVEARGGRRWMNSRPWRPEEVDGGDEQYPVESRFAVLHTPPNEQDPRFDRSAPTQVRFLRFAVRHAPPDQQDPVLTVAGPTQVRLLRFAVRQALFHRLFCASRLAPTRSVASR